jgi:ABC-type antimicrobial peptide transport system permease subunit
MAGYGPDRAPAMEKRLVDAVRAIPGVSVVGLIDEPPLHMGWTIAPVFKEQTTDLRPANAFANSIRYSVSPEYFRAAGTMLLAGRSISPQDDKGSPRVVVINREFAIRLFGSVPAAIGGHFKLEDGTLVQVVGVAEDGKYTANLAETPQPAMFLPILQLPDSAPWLIVRSNRDPQSLAEAIRDAIRGLDPGLPVFIQSWNEEMNGALFPAHMATLSLGVLGILGAMLALTGIFGMAAYTVSKRLKELGIRMALGAQRLEVLQAALGRPLKLLAFGSLAGLLLGLLATRLLAFIVYQATPRDPLVFAGVVLAMSLLGLVATWMPAQRALAVKPIVLLREE